MKIKVINERKRCVRKKEEERTCQKITKARKEKSIKYIHVIRILFREFSVAILSISKI
jgi:hypothetical protein